MSRLIALLLLPATLLAQTSGRFAPPRAAEAALPAVAPVSAVSPVSPVPPLPPVPREVRAVWVATVNNLDWPSRPGLSTYEQQEELRAILDRAASLRMNTVIFQVRPESDAMYRSTLEPWSRYLTGEQGRAPAPGWDPLAFAVREAHQRGLELHAWFNPYRVAYDKSQVRARSHVSRRRPDLVVEYGKFLWMDPSLHEVRRTLLRVVTDVVRRYDVDGVHIDDYFYPYPQTVDGKRIAFPDAARYRAYRRGGGRLSLADWRRRNVDWLVRDLYAAVKREKRWVKVGISPFGIWRDRVPRGITGLDQYNVIYADARKWLREGSLDYLAPQLYWPTHPARQSFPVLLDWWVQESVKGRHVMPGLALYKLPLSGPRRMRAGEIVEQIDITRRTPKAAGHVLFNARVLMQNVDGIADHLDTVYAEAAIAPSYPWLSATPPGKPLVRVARSDAELPVLHVAPHGTRAVRFWVMQARVDRGWRTTVLPGATRTHILRGEHAAADLVAISAVDRTGNLSEPAIVSPAGIHR